VSGLPKTYAEKALSARTLNRNTLFEVREINLNCCPFQLVNVDSIKDVILGADPGKGVTMFIDRKINRNMNKFVDSGVTDADAVVTDSEPEDKVRNVVL
jgi:hypothetical protein